MKYEDDDVESTLSALSVALSASPLDESGAMRFSSEERELGFVLMERGSVCFATALGMQHRLTELIIEHTSIPSEALEAVWARCRSDRQPIVDALAEHDVLPPPALEAVLLQHTVESLEQIATLRPVESTWEPHTGIGYESPFQFSLPQVMTHAAAHHAGRDITSLEGRLRKLIDARSVAITFSPSGRLPVALVGECALSLEEILHIGDVARGLWAHLAATGPKVISAATDHGTLVSFERDGLCTVVLSTETSSTARLLGRFMRGDYGDL